MTDSINQANDESRRRLADVIARLSDDDLATVIDGEWTVAAEFGHLAFWDRLLHARWTEALATNRPEGPILMPTGIPDMLNVTGIRDWARLPGRLAAQGALEAAERTDALIAGLAPERIAAALADEKRVTTVVRTRHRAEHLDTIEKAVPSR